VVYYHMMSFRISCE